MIAEEISCNPRNVFCGEIYGDVEHSLNLYGTAYSPKEGDGEEEQNNFFDSLRNIEIDYQVSK